MDDFLATAISPELSHGFYMSVMWPLECMQGYYTYHAVAAGRAGTEAAGNDFADELKHLGINKKVTQPSALLIGY